MRLPEYRRPVRIPPALLLVAATALGAVAWSGPRLGTWLIHEDPLEHAVALAVLNGDFPYRVDEAAALYQRGWAREVWLTQVPSSPAEAAQASRGLIVDPGTAANQRVLERLGVPRSAVRVIRPGVRDTAGEVQALADEARRHGHHRIIVVTSPWHTRRSRALWRALAGDSPRAIVRAASPGPWDARRWWRDPEGVRLVTREIYGLGTVWAGLALAPARPGAGRPFR